MLRSMVWIGLLVLAGACASPRPEQVSAPVEPARATQIVPLKSASATEMAATLKELLEASRAAVVGRGCPGYFERPGAGAGQPDRGASRPPSVEADPRTNSVVVVASDEVDLSRILELIARLDQDRAPPP
jgi:type II secretory pathway component GspD/PulD (secretin)